MCKKCTLLSFLRVHSKPHAVQGGLQKCSPIQEAYSHHRSRGQGKKLVKLISTDVYDTLQPNAESFATISIVTTTFIFL